MINLKGSFKEARFEAELAPHRSMSMAGARLAVTAASFLMGPPIAFTLVTGYWPVALALATTYAGLGTAFARNARDAEERQILAMDDQGLHITHTRPDWEKPEIYHIAVPPYARIEEIEIRGRPKLNLRHHDRQIPLGHFLPPAETQNLQENLKLALRAWSPVSVT